MKINCIFTDLDGTLLNSNSSISDIDLKNLYFFYEKNILVVPITGRNFFSLSKVIKKHFPIDFVIFSNGAGIFDRKQNFLIYKENLPQFLLNPLINFLIEENLNFFVQFPIGQNHKFFFYQSYKCTDFENRIKLYQDFAFPLKKIPSEASQIIVILSDDENQFFFLKEKLLKNFGALKIIRSTSPLNHKNIWLEIFSEKVSKANAALKLCKHLNKDIKTAISIGNDYNDFDLLKLTPLSFVVKNTHLKNIEGFIKIKTNDEHPLQEVKTFLIKNNLI